jgi:DNA-binding response OmpR family regulator
MNILIIEDDENLALRIKSIFFKKIILNRIKIINNFPDFLNEIYIINSYDVILVDILLWEEKDGTGIDVIRHIRLKNKFIPVIIISWLNDVLWLKVAFDNWANDYICKPFRLIELEVRMLKWFNCFLTSKYDMWKKYLDYHSLKYDFSNNVFLIDWKSISITKLDKYVLLLFISKKEKLLTNLYLIEKIWWDSNLVERNLRIVIFRLKKSLESYQIDWWIKNVRGEWYILKK